MAPSEKITFFDRILVKHGPEILLRTFHEEMNDNSEHALEIINDERLSFPSLYVLNDGIEKWNLYEQMCGRNQIAHDLLQEFVDGTDRGEWNDSASSDHALHVQAVLNWMIETGCYEDVDMEYMEAIDTSVSVLVSIYREQAMLPTVAAMIFHRFHKQLPYHTLAWAFFEACEPYSLALIGDRLISKRQRDRECARRLLQFIPGVGREDVSENYDVFCSWLEENGPFLRLKGESFDTTHQPTPYVIVPEAKYFGKFVSAETGKMYSGLTKKEQKQSKLFQALNQSLQIELASLSAKRRLQNYHDWKQWMRYTCAKQLEQAGGDRL